MDDGDGRLCFSVVFTRREVNGVTETPKESLNLQSLKLHDWSVSNATHSRRRRRLVPPPPGFADASYLKPSPHAAPRSELEFRSTTIPRCGAFQPNRPAGGGSGSRSNLRVALREHARILPSRSTPNGLLRRRPSFARASAHRRRCSSPVRLSPQGRPARVSEPKLGHVSTVRAGNDQIECSRLVCLRCGR